MASYAGARASGKSIFNAIFGADTVDVGAAAATGVAAGERRLLRQARKAGKSSDVIDYKTNLQNFGIEMSPLPRIRTQCPGGYNIHMIGFLEDDHPILGDVMGLKWVGPATTQYYTGQQAVGNVGWVHGEKNPVDFQTCDSDDIRQLDAPQWTSEAREAVRKAWNALGDRETVCEHANAWFPHQGGWTNTDLLTIPQWGGYYHSSAKLHGLLSWSATDFQTFSHSNFYPQIWDIRTQENDGDRYMEEWNDATPDDVEDFDAKGGWWPADLVRNMFGTRGMGTSVYQNYDVFNTLDLHPMNMGGKMDDWDNDLLAAAGAVEKAEFYTDQILDFDFHNPVFIHESSLSNREIAWVPFKVHDWVTNGDADDHWEGGCDTHWDGQPWDFYEDPGDSWGTGITDTDPQPFLRHGLLYPKGDTYRHWFDIPENEYYVKLHNRPWKAIRHLEADRLCDTKAAGGGVTWSDKSAQCPEGGIVDDISIIVEYLPNYTMSENEAFLYETCSIKTIDGQNYCGFNVLFFHYPLSHLMNVSDPKVFPNDNWGDNLSLHAYKRYYAGNTSPMCPGWKDTMKEAAKTVATSPVFQRLSEDTVQDTHIQSVDNLKKHAASASKVQDDTVDANSEITFSGLLTPKWYHFKNSFRSKKLKSGKYLHSYKSGPVRDNELDDPKQPNQIMLGYDWVSDEHSAYRFKLCDLDRKVTCWDKHVRNYNDYVARLKTLRKTESNLSVTRNILATWQFSSVVQDSIGKKGKRKYRGETTGNLLHAHGMLNKNKIIFHNMKNADLVGKKHTRYLNFKKGMDKKIEFDKTIFSNIKNFGIIFKIYVPSDVTDGRLLKFGDFDLSFKKSGDKRRITLNGTPTRAFETDTWTRICVTAWAKQKKQRCMVYVDDAPSQSMKMNFIDFSAIDSYDMCDNFEGKFTDVTILSKKVLLADLNAVEYLYYKKWEVEYNAGAYTTYQFETPIPLTMETARPAPIPRVFLSHHSDDWLGKSIFRLYRQHAGAGISSNKVKRILGDV